MVGAISVFPSSIFVACTSIISMESVWNIVHTRYKEHTVTSAPKLHPTIAIILLIGTFTLRLGWLTVTICSLFYNYQSEYWIQVPHQNAAQSCSPFGPGKPRGETVPDTIVSATWVIVVQLPIGKWFPFHGIIVVGPLLHLAMLLTTGCFGGTSTMSGVFASVLSMMYMAFVGTALSTVDHIMLAACTLAEISLDNIKYGGIIGLIFMSLVLCLWPFYLHYPSSTSWPGENRTPTAAQQVIDKLHTTEVITHTLGGYANRHLVYVW